MRLVLATLVLLVGCRADDVGSGGFGGPGPEPDPGGGNFGDCVDDTSCGTEVCSRTHVCLPADEVHLVKAVWTVNGQPASASTCTVVPELQITFTGGGGDWGYAPVPCVEGSFAIDKFPIWFDAVQLGSVTDFGGMTAEIDPTTGLATLDLVY